jgi:hypothetical protein
VRFQVLTATSNVVIIFEEYKIFVKMDFFVWLIIEIPENYEAIYYILKLQT